jgi:hypothetical protein
VIPKPKTPPAVRIYDSIIPVRLSPVVNFTKPPTKPPTLRRRLQRWLINMNEGKNNG